MTNREKYLKTDDAVKAYHREHYNGSFIKWLDEEAEPAEPAKDEASLTPDDLASGLGLAGIFSALLDGKSHKCECGCDMADGRQTHVKIEIDVASKSPSVQDEKPLPCPFCGSETTVKTDKNAWMPKVYCSRCCLSGGYGNIAAYGDTLAEAVRNWNTRAAR